MRKISLYLQISLDGIASDIEKWGQITDEIMQDSIDAFTHDVDTAVFGGNTYTSMGEYWQKAEETSKWELEKKFAKKLNDTHKIVISRSKVDLTWRNSEQILLTDPAALAREIQKLKNTAGKTIAVESGVGMWQQFVEHDLYDALHLLVHPVVVGKGKKLFTENSPLAKLELSSTKKYSNGVVGLHYVKK